MIPNADWRVCKLMRALCARFGNKSRCWKAKQGLYVNGWKGCTVLIFESLGWGMEFRFRVFGLACFGLHGLGLFGPHRSTP